MKGSRKLLILFLALLAFGAARFSFEHSLSEELRESGLTRGELEIGTRDKIDQTSSAVALGGMRTLVATFFNLKAQTHFEEQEWDELQETYNTIVDLAPRTRYYWETGSWHLSYNAASHYLHYSELPALRRRELWRSFVHRGRDFLERGIRNNPEDWSLHASLAALLRDPNKLPAFRDREESLLMASEAYAQAARLGARSPMRMQRFRLYCLARVPGREQESLELARELYAAHPVNRKPTLLMLLYALECHADPQRDVEALALDIFGSAERAYEALKLHWERSREGFPLDGVARGIAAMEDRLGVPMPQSVLRTQPPSPPTIEDWFKSR